MIFQDSYFESEVKEGFFVTSMMKRSWAAQIEILEDVDKVCRKYGITYFADAGTLLGTVRHQGFIPWDDDLDICMLRKDYNRFIAVAQKELPDYYIRNIHTDDTYTEFFTRLLNSREINFEPDFLKKFHGCPYGMGIDIFVMDYVPSSVDERNFLHLVLNSLDQVITEASIGKLTGENLADQIAMIENMLHIKIDPNRPWMNQLLLLEENLFSMYSEKEAEDITIMPSWMKMEQYKWPKSWYTQIVQMPFDYIMVPVPVMYDAILAKKFGEYLRGVKKGSKHDYPLFGKQEIALTETLGSNPYIYEYSETALERIYDSGTKSVKNKVKQLLHLLYHLYDQLKDIKNIQEIFNILSQCQETAIAMGTILEKELGENCAAVKNLENYCEIIYQLHEALAKYQTREADRIFFLLESELEKINSNVRGQIDLRYEAVFLPYKAELWGHLESIWQAAKKDSDCNAYVMPIPYFYKKPDGGVGELHDDADQFPDDITILKYDTIDFSTWHPDVIYMQNPFDEYDCAVSVHPFFYSENLKQYTNQLVYISPYVIDEENEIDDRTIANLRYCCACPGVMHADKVIVQSEKVREVYIKILTEFAGIHTKQKWEEKILGLGSPIMDLRSKPKAKQKDLPKEWTNIMTHADGSWKKIVLYGTDVSALLRYEDKMIEKIKHVFAIFKEKCQEIVMLWVPYGIWDQNSEVKYQKLCQEYEKLQIEYLKEGWGILVAADQIDKALACCDAYYGDRSYMAQFCIDAKLPVMVQDVKC